VSSFIPRVQKSKTKTSFTYKNYEMNKYDPEISDTETFIFK